MCDEIHYGEVEGLVPVERWSCNRGASNGRIHYVEVEGLVSTERWSCYRGASCLVECTMWKLRDWSLLRGGLLTEVLHV